MMRPTLLLVFCVSAVFTLPAHARRGRHSPLPEVQYPHGRFKKLDTFEAHSLAKCDKEFNRAGHRRAYQLYDNFVLEFGKSDAVAFALFRKARCLHMLNKRFQAIKAYEEVLDYFDDDIPFAAPALFFIGRSHAENGDRDKAMKAWAELADDEEYSRHSLAANAIYMLADNYAKRKEADKAVKYFRQVAVDFHHLNPDASLRARDRVIEHCVRTKPDEAKLRQFYVDMKTFGRARTVRGKLDTDRPYWHKVRDLVKRSGRFAEDEEGLRRSYYRYWTGQLAGKFLDDDGYQLDLARFQLAYEGDAAKWMERVDAQFERNQEPDDWDRILRWMSLYGKHRTKVMQYYKKLKFDNMTTAQIWNLARLFYGQNQPDLGRNTFRKIRLRKVKDGQKASFAQYFWKRDKTGELVVDILMTMEDQEGRRMELLKFYHYRARSHKDRKMAAKGLKIAGELDTADRFARDAIWMKAEIFEVLDEFAKAILAYQEANNPPGNLWRIAECYARLKRLKEAVAQIREMEGFFQDQAPRAALHVAGLFRRFDRRQQEVAQLRYVLKKYPKSRQSSEAHVRLERLGEAIGKSIRIGGGVEDRENQ